ncbi:MAG: flagellar basal body rod protein FlgF [Gammaproteobacteria bacterium]|nr:flagellar basal body rod protein FlgF [Gammaproteobacteria bacterium]
MDKMLFIAMNGAKQAMQAQTNISHNLANASTLGFKENLDSFSTWHVEGPGFNSRAYNRHEASGINLMPGSFTSTGRDLDIAVNGEGWIAIQAPDGSQAYTRAGDLRINANGMLTNGVGHPVIGNSGPIVIPPADKVEIGADGSISIIPTGQTADTMAILDRIRLVNPDQSLMQKGPDGLLRYIDGNLNTANPDASVSLASGVLEQSNVNAVSELVNLIENARQFEANVKIMKTAQESDEVSARLLRNS